MRWLSGFVMALGALFLIAGLGAYALYSRPGPLPHDATIVIPHGRLVVAIETLQREGALTPGNATRYGFRLAARLTRGQGRVHAGELVFPAHASWQTLLHVLRSGRPVQHELTIPEGLTAAQIAWLVEQAPALSGQAEVPQEGSILPETYAYELATPRSVLLARMRQAMRRKLAMIWDGRDPAAGLSGPNELVRLASIVERETAIAAERPQVAGVFLNRLRLHMRLQSDPTVAYAASGGLGNLTRPLSHADLEYPNLYNTYVIAGLPPTAICAPGAAALEAVAHPAASNSLYFVADGTGGHAFAATLADHLRNVARLRAREIQPAQPATLP